MRRAERAFLLSGDPWGRHAIGVAWYAVRVLPRAMLTATAGLMLVVAAGGHSVATILGPMAVATGTLAAAAWGPTTVIELAHAVVFSVSAALVWWIGPGAGVGGDRPPLAPLIAFGTAVVGIVAVAAWRARDLARAAAARRAMFADTGMATPGRIVRRRTVPPQVH